MSANRNYTDVVAAFDAAAELRRKPLMVVGERSVSYGQVLEQASRLTRVYRERGWSAGDRIVIASADAPSVLTLHLSLLRNGLTSIVVDPTATEREVRGLLAAASPRGVFADVALAPLWQAAGATDVIEIRPPGSGTGALFRKLLRQRVSPAESASFPAILENIAPDDPPARIDAESIAYILFTSGSTASPKGVTISHRALFTHLATMRRQFGYDAETRLLNILPLHHTDGMNHGPLTAFTCGGTSFRLQRFTLQQLGLLLDTIYKERITHLIAVPTLLAMMQQTGPQFDEAFATPEFRFVVSSAAPLAPSLWEEFQARFRTRIANVYGLTETVVGGLFCGPGDADFRLGTVGRAIDCEARIVDAEGQLVADGEVGELEMRGDNLLSGYFGDAAATADTFRDGWFRTGDFASVEEGFFRISGRKKNLIIAGGYNVQPEEVTEVLVSMPDVVEAVTLGVPDEILGERVVACVSLADDSTIDEDAIVAFCRQHLAPVKVPTRLYILPFLPKGASGKIDTSQVRELMQASRQRRSGDADGDLHGRVLAAAAETFTVPVADLHSGSRPENTPGWDSFAHLQLVVALEDTFAIRLTTRDVLRIASLGDAETVVAEKLG